MNKNYVYILADRVMGKQSLRDRRVFNFHSGTTIVILKIKNHEGLTEDAFVIRYSGKAGEYSESVAALSSWRKAFRATRHKLLMDNNPSYRKVHNRLEPEKMFADLLKGVSK